MASDDHVPIGTLLANQYRLTEIVGEGGMGVVYRARQETVGRDVAVKILRARHAKDEVVVRRFENEARIISQLRHPNTLRLYDTQRMENGGLFIVTEYLQGQSLEQLLRQGRMKIDRVLSIADQICASLSEAHEMGVVHRDLKPGNIFLDRVGGEDFVKVLDFGIAKLQAGGIVKTQANVIMGTPAYMSPEQVKGETADARSDIYAVGVLIYQMLAGVQPFVADNPVTILMKQVNDPPPPLAQKADVPPELEGLVFEMLSKHPDFRPQRITEVRDRLRTIARTLGSHLPAPTPSMTPRPQPFQALLAPQPPKHASGLHPQPTIRYPMKERSDEMPTQPNMAPVSSLDATLPPQPQIDSSQIPMTIPIEMDHAIDASAPPALEMFLDEGPQLHRQGSAQHAQSGNRMVIIGAVAVVIVLAVVGLFLARPSDDAPVSEEVAAPAPAPDPVPRAPIKQEPIKQEPIKQEPIKQEPVQAKQEPAQAEEEPAKTQTAKAEPAEPAKSKDKPRRKKTHATDSEEDTAADDALDSALSKLPGEQPAEPPKEEPAKTEEAPSAEPTPIKDPPPPSAGDEDLKEDSPSTKTSSKS